MKSFYFLEDDLPSFIKVQDILVISEIVFVVAEKYYTIGINDHILGYQFLSMS